MKEDYSIWMKARMTKDSFEKYQDKKLTKETYISSNTVKKKKKKHCKI